MRCLSCVAVWVVLSGSVLGQLTSSPLRVFIPPTQDQELLHAFSSPEYEWYTADSRPPIYQQSIASDYSTRWHSIYDDVGPGGPRFANGNGEWPWAHPSVPTNDGRTRNVIGARVTGYRTFKQNLNHYELVTSGGRVSNLIRSGTSVGNNWSFADGTDFIELVTNRIVDGDYTFKVHRMTMVNGRWEFRVYRPFNTKESYEKATNTEVVFKGLRFLRSGHVRPAFFREKVEIWEAPQISPDLSRRLLERTPFALSDSDDFIPTTRYTDQLYPRDYLGSYIGNGINDDNCRRCHQHVLKHVRQFGTGEWYGFIRGGGHDITGSGVFSWYPRR